MAAFTGLVQASFPGAKKPSDWEMVMPHALFFIESGRIFPAILAKPDPRHAPAAGQPTPQPLILSYRNLVDCGQDPGTKRVFLTFKGTKEASGTGGSAQICYVAAELKDIVSSTGESLSEGSKALLFSRVYEKANQIKTDLKTPFIHSLPARFGNPDSFDFDRAFDVQGAICDPAVSSQFRLSAEFRVYIATDAEMRSRSSGGKTPLSIGANSALSWLVIDAAECGVVSLPITGSLQFQLYPEDLQMSLVLRTDRQAESHVEAEALLAGRARGLRRGPATKDAAGFTVLALLFHDSATYRSFTDEFSEALATTTRCLAGYSATEKDFAAGSKFAAAAYRQGNEPRTSGASEPENSALSIEERFDRAERRASYKTGRTASRTAPQASEEQSSAGDFGLSFSEDSDDEPIVEDCALPMTHTQTSPEQQYILAPKDALLLKSHNDSIDLSSTGQFLFQKSIAAITHGQTLDLYGRKGGVLADASVLKSPTSVLTRGFTLKDDSGSPYVSNTFVFNPSTAEANGMLTTKLNAQEDEQDRIFFTDIEKGVVAETYSAFNSAAESHPAIMDFAVGDASLGQVAGASIGASDAIVYLTKAGVHVLDRRIAGPSQRTGIGYTYSRSQKFNVIVVTSKGNVVTASESGEIRCFSKVGNRALTTFPGLGIPITALAVTQDESWLVGTCANMLLVYNLKGETSDAFRGHGLKPDERQPPRILRLSPETLRQIGITISDGLKPATFSLDEKEVITGTETYVLVWDFEKVKKGVVDSSKVCKMIRVPNYVIGAGGAMQGLLMVGTEGDLRILKHK